MGRNTSSDPQGVAKTVVIDGLEGGAAVGVRGGGGGTGHDELCTRVEACKCRSTVSLCLDHHHLGLSHHQNEHH